MFLSSLPKCNYESKNRILDLAKAFVDPLKDHERKIGQLIEESFEAGEGAGAWFNL